MTPTYEQLITWFTPERTERFWEKVDKRTEDFGCWLWTGSRSDSGHGQYRMLGGVARVHRLMWVWVRERDVSEWMVVRHMCNIAPCLNPRHLIGGDQGENVEDMFQQSAFDRAKDELARMEYLAAPYAAYFSENTICNRGIADSVRSGRLHMVNTGDSNGMYPLPTAA